MKKKDSFCTKLKSAKRHVKIRQLGSPGIEKGLGMDRCVRVCSGV